MKVLRLESWPKGLGWKFSRFNRNGLNSSCSYYRESLYDFLKGKVFNKAQSPVAKEHIK